MTRLFVSVALLVSTAASSQATERARRPNVLLILADDLGFSDLGCYGGEIETPNLDKLAENGLRFTQFYNTARCWPTRAALMTGYYAQQVRRDSVPGVPSGGRGRRPDWAPLLAERLRSLGYRTYHSGKWHIDGMPLAGGFDESYYLRDQGRFFYPRVHYENDEKLAAVEKSSKFYATTAIADHAIRCLREHARENLAKPFFHYLAFTAPHFPLHALPEDIARYRERYRAGWDAIRAARYRRIRENRIVLDRLSSVEREVGPPYDFPGALKKLGPGEVNRPVPWDQLTPEQREFQATKMAIHAAMVDRMDREIGRVLAQLRAMGAYDDTLVLFLSDNGASAEIMVRDDGHDRSASPGSGPTYLCLGPGWSNASNTPFRRHKTWVHEGGIATPFVAHWPAGISAKGELRREVAHAIDVPLTILELAGGKLDPSPGGPRFPGQSLTSTLRADRAASRELWWRHEKNRALRLGDWKIVAAGKDSEWELYDLSKDRTETENLAAIHVAKTRELARIWDERWGEIQSQARGESAKREGSKPRSGKHAAPVFACDFESKDWRRTWSSTRNDGRCELITSDPARKFEALSGKALRVRVDRGGHFGASLLYKFREKLGAEPEEIYLRYYLRFADDWDPARGGKLPGISGTYGRAGWGGRKVNGRDGWSARGLFEGQKSGRTPVGTYCYHADMKGKYGSHWRWNRDDRGQLENNRWYAIEQYVKMNTPGKRDGIIRAWVDGKLAMERTDIRFRDVPTLKIEAIWMNVYFGGTSTAESAHHLYLDEVVVSRDRIGPLRISKGEL